MDFEAGGFFFALTCRMGGIRGLCSTGNGLQTDTLVIIMSPRCHRLVVLLFVVTAAFARETKAELALVPVPPVSAAVFTFGGDVRLRYEGYDNVHTLSSEAPFHVRDYLRLRTRLWANYNGVPNLSLYGRLAAEPRCWFNNATVDSAGREWKYVLVDNLYAKWSTAQSSLVPVSVVAGRQDVLLGDHWLVGEGTPGDGTWTSFFDGLRATIDVKSIKTKFDLMAFRPQVSAVDYLPILGRQGTCLLMEQDEIGAILNATNKTIQNAQLDGYFIYKKDKRVTSTGNNGEVYTLGARIAGTPSANWQYSVEGAYQWGRRDLQVRYPATITYKRDVAAYGLNSKLTYLLKDKLNNQFSILAEYLSGDDPDSTDKDEMFDVLWGRCPRVGETWNVAYAVETGGRAGQYQNLYRVGATWAVSPTKSTTVATTYCALFAPESVPTRMMNTARFSRDGHFRGHMVQTVVRQKITKEVSALLHAEASFLGDYYVRRDTVAFVRAEVMYTF